MAKPKIEELAIPPDAMDHGGTEVLRAFVVDGALSISFRTAFENPEVWGMLLVDLARHAARGYAHEGLASEEDALLAIREQFEAEWDDPADEDRLKAMN